MNKNCGLKTGLKDILEKKERVISFLENKKLDAVVIGKPDNFAWFTCGGNNRVIKSWDSGFSFLIISRKKNFLISQIMDGPRVIDEELEGLDIEYVPLRWTDVSREEKTAELIKGLRVASDIPVKGAIYSPEEFSKLHSPFTGLEIERMRWLGAKTEEILRNVAEDIVPGNTEIEISGMLSGEFGRLGIECDVLMVGGDERIGKYRHPVPSEKKVKRLVLLHPATRKWGLHIPVSRMLNFGKPSSEIIKKFNAAREIAAAVISKCKKGEKFSNILMEQEILYKRLGYADEWEKHYHGGLTGYFLVELISYKQKESEVLLNQFYDWFITITGVKFEEIVLVTEKGIEICTAAGNWPTTELEYDGNVYLMPEILIK